MSSPCWPVVRPVRIGLLLLSLWLAAPAPGPAAEVRGRVTALEFTSDHNLVCRNPDDLLHGGPRYPDIEWMRDPPVNAPITHTGGDAARIRVKVTLALEGVEGPTPYRLEGASAEPALCFRKEGQLRPAKETLFELEATGSLGRAVRKLRRKIAWTLTLRPGTPAARKVELGETGPHVIYVTFGTPKGTDDPLGVVTDARMALAVRLMAAAQAKAGPKASPPRIVHELMQAQVPVYYPRRHYRRESVWQVPASWNMDPPGTSCYSICEFTRRVCAMIGLDGEMSVAPFCAMPEDPAKGVRGELGAPPRTRTGYYGETWQLFLVDGTNSAEGQVGGVGGVNYYEAALVYAWKGARYYYPGGTLRVYGSPDQVIRIFRTMAWARYDPAVRDWVVTEVVHTYVEPGQESPADVPLP